jgi:PAS domain S-box-containing protein
MPSSRRILVVEDSRTQAERVRVLLEREGWEVACAASAEAALDQINRSRPDLIVLDYYLPGMNGDEFCREIRMNVNTRGIPVLMLTVEETDDAERRGLESGADDYLAKSADPDILLLRARALLRKSPDRAPVLSAADASFNRARLLAIDDSPTYLHYLTRELGAEHYAVETASSGEAGLARVRKEPFDCVVVDLEMPSMSGIEVCRALAGIERTLKTPITVVMLTAHEEKEWMTRSLEAGADDFIGKSADISVLKARIRALLRRRSFIEQNRRIIEELKERELEAVRARAAKEAAEVRAVMADRLEQGNQELEQANRRLKEVLGVTRAITEHAAEAMFLTDATGRVTFMNPAAERLFGYVPDELKGRVLHDSMHPAGLRQPGCESCPLVRALENGLRITVHEDVFYGKDGEPVEVSYSISPVSEEGVVVAGVLVVRDISEYKRAEERLRQTQKLESIGLLAGGIAHDFNNILTGVIGTASLLEEDAPPEMASDLRTILDGAERAADLTRQLLAYAGKGQFIVRHLDLSALVREMMSLLRLSASRNIQLDLRMAESLPPVAADPGQVQQIVMNLVINAGEAIGDQPGTVSIATSVEDVAAAFIDAAGTEIPPGRYVCLEVRDNGCGMDEPTRVRVLDPFFTTKFTGRGLGLAAVSGIIRAQGGAIRIDSAPGRGSVFTVLFPPARVSSLPASAPAR